ncbi:UNVERIFIED_ORG: hypothetical protein FHR35_008538 [Microbispora rosea subsp. rosea]
MAQQRQRGGQAPFGHRVGVHPRGVGEGHPGAGQRLQVVPVHADRRLLHERQARRQPYGLRVEGQGPAPVADHDLGLGQRVQHRRAVAAGGDAHLDAAVEVGEQAAHRVLRKRRQRENIPRHGRSLARLQKHVLLSA